VVLAAIATGSSGGRQTLRKSKTTVINVETERIIVIRRQSGSAVAWCVACSEQVEMITPAEAARRAAVTTRTIYRRVESGTLHFTETGDGSLLICSTSLVDSIGTMTRA
jgi:excisionase family DNA binding protein